MASLVLKWRHFYFCNLLTHINLFFCHGYEKSRTGEIYDELLL